MHLDILQNPPLSQALNAPLLQQSTQNLPPISQGAFRQEQNALHALSQHFQGQSGGNFGFSVGDFIALFILLHKHNHKIGFAISNHQQAYEAYLQSKDILPLIPIVPEKQTGIITSLPQNCDVFILPYINQDILTRNPIATLKMQHPNALFIVDISYALAFGEKLDFGISPSLLLLCDGESLGFLRHYGVFLGTQEHLKYFPKVRYVQGLYSAFLTRIQEIQTPTDQKIQALDLLSKALNTQAELFVPLSSCYTNCLPLRLKGIKARNLLQGLFIQNIHAINGQECLFGFSSPSFVLQEMGYSELESRELLSLSFMDLESSSLQAIATQYIQLKTLEI